MPKWENLALSSATKDLERALLHLRRVHLELLRGTKPCTPKAREFRRQIQLARVIFERGLHQTESVERALSPAPVKPAGVRSPRRRSPQRSNKRRVRFSFEI